MTNAYLHICVSEHWHLRSVSLSLRSGVPEMLQRSALVRAFLNDEKKLEVLDAL